MNNKSVLITGAVSGIGQSLAKKMSTRGYFVIATDLDKDSVNKTVKEINKLGRKANAIKIDVTKEDDIKKMMAALGDRRIDILINNAGLQYVSKLEEFPQDKWNQLIQVMLVGACMMTRAVLPFMRKQSFGRIINIGSIHSLVASPFKSAYVSAKHGLLGFSKVIALETADTNITINTICPSYVKTPLVDKQIVKQAKEHNISEDEVISKIMLKPMPKGVFISIDEILGIIEFLISGNARNITGQTITVDGGWTIG